VDLFFVLSGFLIGGILFREIQRNGQLHVRRFLLRRAFKIWPGYLAVVVFALLKDSRHAEHGLGLAAMTRMYWANFLLPMFWLDLDRSLFVQTAGFSLLYIGYGCILIGVLGIKHGRGFSGRLLASPPARLISRIGLFSYAIYLWHIDLAIRPMVKIAPLLHSHLSPMLASLATLAAVIMLACAAGILLTFLIEKPALAVRDWLVPAEGQRQAERTLPDDQLQISVARRICHRFTANRATANRANSGTPCSIINGLSRPAASSLAGAPSILDLWVD
jgi:peptidoglycan/LPS O-acetylase OafA/YrhL